MLCLQDLRCWLHLPRLSLGVSPDLHFLSDASEVGWAPISTVRSLPACGTPNRQRCLSTPGYCSLFSWGFFQFRSALRGRTVAVFCVNATALTYLRMEGGTRYPLLNTLGQEILRWTESLSIRLAPQFLPGSDNVLADALSRPHQLPHTEWSLT